MTNTNQLTKTYAALAVLLGVWLWSYWDALSHMVTVWSQSESFKHCFFIPVISAYLVYEKRARLSLAHIKPVWWLLIPLALGQIAFVIVSQLGINLLMHVSAYLTFVLALWAVLGHKQTRIILFPLVYLAFAVPFGEELVPVLQEVTADLSVGMLKLVNIPVYREGLYIYLSNGTFHVAEACAGVRFLIGTFAIGVLLAYLNYQKLWKRTAFIALCAVIPIVANGIRAFGIMVIGYLSNMEHATGADHLVYGWFFFAFVMVILFLIGNIGNDPAPQHTINTTDDSKTDSTTINSSSRANANANTNITPLVLLAVLITPVLLTKTLFSQETSTAAEVPFAELTQTFNQNIKPQPLAWSAETPDPVWQGNIKQIPTRLVFVDELHSGKELVSGRHRIFDNENWTQQKLSNLTINNVTVGIAEVVNVRGYKVKLAGWYQTDQLQSINGLKIKVQQLMNRLAGRSPNGYFIVVEYENEADIANALTTLKRLTEVEGR